MSLRGSFMPLGVQFFPLGIKCMPPLCVRAPFPDRTRPPIELCGLQLVQYNGSLHLAIQRGSDVAATVDKVTSVLPC
jgi:hypothetical protein